MTSRDFCYWLQGFFEIARPVDKDLPYHMPLSKEQMLLIEKHLAMVFHHEIDPSFGKDQPRLDQIHSGLTEEAVKIMTETLKKDPQTKVYKDGVRILMPDEPGWEPPKFNC